MGGSDGGGSELPGGRLSRRTLLRRAGASLGVGGAGALALPEATGSHDTSDPETRGVDADAEALAEDEVPYGVWHYKPVGGEMRPTAPINVVFPLEAATFGQVTATCRRAGLAGPPLEYVRFAWDRDRERYRRQEWTAAETAVGVSGRLHVRCWKLAGTASMQAHVDTAATPKHRIHTYSGARDAVERLFREAGWTVADPVHLGNDKVPDHDGFASVIRR
ncbi:hypothetical protein BRD00_00460 [Halobacteriales archaeon QS_8_69_26]|nr:MAG: hypothetical protein BRD00_00460 [Halobacteriales archaeon QS_8_69_26]